jgi:hypothetical protein
LSYVGKVPADGIEPSLRACRARVLPLNYAGVHPARIEPASLAYQTRALTIELRMRGIRRGSNPLPPASQASALPHRPQTPYNTCPRVATHGPPPSTVVRTSRSNKLGWIDRIRTCTHEIQSLAGYQLPTIQCSPTRREGVFHRARWRAQLRYRAGSHRWTRTNKRLFQRQVANQFALVGSGCG